MSYDSVSNIVTALLCLAVLVQSARMMRGLKQVRNVDLGESIRVLDDATLAARSVLGELKAVLENEGRANCSTVDEGQKIRDELGMLINLADSMAERLVEAASRTQKAAETSPPSSGEWERPTYEQRTPKGTPQRRSSDEMADIAPMRLDSYVLPVRRRSPTGMKSVAMGNGPATLNSAFAPRNAGNA